MNPAPAQDTRTLIAALASIAVVWGLFVQSAVARKPGAESRPNVLLISIDDLNDWCGCLGGHPNARTPHIDRLARRGTLFVNAHCQAPVCTPSRASLVTGRLPSSTRMYFLQPHLHLVNNVRGVVTLAERFARDGYRTLGVGKVYGGHERRYFQEYGGAFGGFGPRPRQKINYPIGHQLWDWGAFPKTDEQMPDHQIADWAAERLKARHDRPFFLAVGFFRPHVPMYAPQPWLDRHPLKSVQLPKVLDSDRNDLPRYAKDLTIGTPAPRHEWFGKHPGQWHKAVQAYLASTSFVDHQVGRVIEALDAGPNASNTVIVLFSDHGWHLGEKQRWAKRSLWEDSTRVPLIVCRPGSQRGSRTNRPAGLLDIYPTLLELCGLKVDATLEGHSLVPLMKDPHAEWPHMAITTFGPRNHAVRSTRWRFIRYADGSQELYDHKTDPHEWHNLAGNNRYAMVIKQHARHLPRINKPLLPKPDSYGLKAYLDAEKRRTRKRVPETAGCR